MNQSDKPKIVFMIGRGVTGPLCRSAIETFSFLKNYLHIYDIVFVSQTKTEQATEYIEKVASIKIAHTHHATSDHWDEAVQSKKYSSWMEFYEKEDWYADITNVKHVILMSSLLSNSNGWNRRKKKVNKDIFTQAQMNYMSNSRPMSTMLQLIKLSNRENANFHEITYDPDEYSWDSLKDILPIKNYTLYHGYNIPEYNAVRLDAIQHYFLYARTDVSAMDEMMRGDKEYDIVFGGTAATPYREKYLLRVLESLEKRKNELRIQTFLYIRSKDIKTLVDRPTYLDKIASSRFTVIIPAYDETQFSYIRFIESIVCNCLPFIGEDVNVKNFVESFGIDTKYIDEIRYDYSTIPNITEERRLELIAYFRSKVLDCKLQYLKNL